MPSNADGDLLALKTVYWAAREERIFSPDTGSNSSGYRRRLELEAASAVDYIAALEAYIRQLEAANTRAREALQELYDAACIVERQIPVATEDWHHDLFAATGNAFAVLQAARAASPPDAEGEG